MPNEDEGLYTENYTFDYANPENKTLHVPASSIEAYKNIDPWCNFKEIIALKEDEFPNVPKCATPKVEIVGGEIVFKCETEEVEFISEVKVPDPKNSYDSKISTPKKYSVSVYAVKANYENSDTATAEFDFSGDTSLSGDVDGNGIVNVADHVKLSSIILDQNE